MELVRNEMTVPLLATAAGMKWLPWIRTDSGLLGSLLPPRLSGRRAEDEEIGKLSEVLGLHRRTGQQDQRGGYEKAAHGGTC